MQITRRELLALAGAAARSDPSGDEVSKRAAAFIGAYSAEGFHRTATTVDRVSADRLVKAVREAKATAALEPFELARVDPGPAFLGIDGRRIDGLPMFDGSFTDPEGVRGAIGAAGTSDAPIGWTNVSPDGQGALRATRAGSSHRAIVAVTTWRHPGLSPVNAQWFTAPFGPPVLQVSSELADAIARVTDRGGEVRVVAHADRVPATAFNVVVDVEGTHPDLPPLCVMTPRSGWHSNASERGGGIVCWLETIRLLTATRPRRTVKFVASSGHELGHLGLHAYLDRRPTLARDAVAWIHLGANIGAVDKDVRTTCSQGELQDITVRAFAESGMPRINPTPALRVAGEAGTIAERGGRFISFIGANEWFHHPDDRWPHAVNVDEVARYAKATAHLALVLGNRLS